MRGALWTAALLNLVGIAALLSPNVVGAMAGGLPQPAPGFYTTQLALVLALFAGAYAWLARRPVIDRPLVVMGMLGRAGFYAVSTAWWRLGELPGRTLLSLSPDLVLAAVFAWWLWGPRQPRHSEIAPGAT
ncbi:MAG TPA: hypothetical protein VFH97_10515 [Gemmatimonadales bacterium]|nr:hypothetical protein [Gemmatimonadales bacterium]